MNNPTDEEKAQYLRLRGWQQVNGAPQTWCGMFTMDQAKEVQDRIDQAAIPNLWGDLSDLAPKVDEQLEKDINVLKNMTDGWTFDGEKSAIARTILHLLKR